MDETKRRPRMTPDDLVAKMPMLVSKELLAEVIEPMVLSVRESLVDLLPVIPEGPNEDILVARIGKAVKDSLVIKHETVENTTVQQMELPAEIVKLLQLQTDAINLLKARATITPDPTIADYRPHDQTIIKGTKLSYYGFEAPSGAWYIMRQNGRTSTQRYAAGKKGYADAWEDRASQTYGLLSEALNDE